MTTITVDDETRKRLKRLSAILNMSQGEIVKASLDLFEKFMVSESFKAKILLPRKVAKMLDDISNQVRQRDPEWAGRSKIIEDSYTQPEEAIWGSEI